MSAPPDWYQEYLRQQAERARHAERVIHYLIPALRFLGVREVVVSYDGAGDEGQIQSADFTPESPAGYPEGLADLIEEVTGYLLPGGWEINEGSSGHLIIDVVSGTHTLEHEWNESDEDEMDDEFE
jgi:hypothetical protein